MMLNALGGRSPLLDGSIGETVSAAVFPRSNWIMDETRYDYEGNWAFCLLDDPEISGARFGFGRGPFDTRDYGGAKPPSRDHFLLQIELMFRDGAVLWFGNELFKGTQVRSDPNRLDVWLESGGKELFRIQGWPAMQWDFGSADGEAEVHARIGLRQVTILPDCIMPRNRFAMWVAFGSIEADVRHRDRQRRVTGTVFYDHPRIKVEANEVPPLGWYLYTPIRLSDGSCIAAYHAEDSRGRRMDDYSFCLYVDNVGRCRWLSSQAVMEMATDADGRLKRWKNAWQGEGLTIRAESEVRDTTIFRSWGSAKAPQTRRDYENVPLIFDAHVSIEHPGEALSLTGTGLAEYLVHTDGAIRTNEP